MSQEDGSVAKPGSGLVAVGWIAIGASILGGAGWCWQLQSILVYPTLMGEVGTIAAGIALGSIGFTAGCALVIVGRRHRPGGSLVLWAKLCIVFGLELCLGVPLLVYGQVLFWSEFTHDPTGDMPGPLDGALLEMVGAASAVPVTIGVCILIAALVWGRRKPSPDVLGVFN